MNIALEIDHNFDTPSLIIKITSFVSSDITFVEQSSMDIFGNNDTITSTVMMMLKNITTKLNKRWKDSARISLVVLIFSLVFLSPLLLVLVLVDEDGNQLGLIILAAKQSVTARC